MYMLSLIKCHLMLKFSEKAAHLLPSWSSCDRLRLFKADLLNEGSFDEAVKGCNGVYHVAASMEFNVMATENIGNAPLNYFSITSIGMKSGAEMKVFDDSSLFELEEAYVQSNIIDPAIKGTLNLLKACLKSKTVERVVFTSSISTITAKDSLGRWRAVVDESCQTPIDHVWKTRVGGWVYVLSKLLTEEAAFQFAKENGIDLVSVITTTVGGPFITSSVPSSIRVLLSPITGEPEFFSILSAVNSRMGSLALVHIEDICNAHIFLMEQAKAEGRYICGVQSYQMSELINHLAKVYPCSNIQRLVEEECGSAPSEICSKKLNDLGFNYKYGLEDIIQQTINCCLDHGFLPQIRR
ncbi:Dihydroflavonol 4-reductase [Vitis vinifera]|uniref:Dihydroflavonol 4-reductase n=1 Tax=Vitis vinifera TaxID=29760 RepID=A0A438IDA0_VITVI|nr:Dihydroflavonol 4-reductase [Vitis vinifera]